MSRLSEQDLQVITDTVQSYFGRLTKERARISASFLAEAGEALPEFDYTGMIQISGAYRGWVYFTAPKLMIRYLLLSVGETLQGDDIFMDTAGEIANTIAGNARKHFGETMQISVPTTRMSGDAAGAWLGKPVHERPMVIHIQWQALAAALVVDLESAATG